MTNFVNSLLLPCYNQVIMSFDVRPQFRVARHVLYVVTRLNYPAEAHDKHGAAPPPPAQPRDFEYAKQELTRVQNER